MSSESQIQENSQVSSSIQSLPAQTQTPPAPHSQPTSLPPSYFTLLKLKPEHLLLSQMAFLKKLYHEYLTPTPRCALCRGTINTPEEWFSFVCDCPIYYHVDCGCDDSFQELSCTSCHQSRDIFTYRQFPAKFLSQELYYKIYQNTVAELPKSQHLLAYQLWFGCGGSSNQSPQAISLNFSGYKPYYTPLLLDLYQYLVPHDPNETMELLDQLLENAKHRIVSFDPAIQVQNMGKNVDIEYDTKKIPDDLYYHRPAMVPLRTFRKKLYEYSYGLIDAQFPFSKSTAIVGGAVHKCLEVRIQLDDVPDYCDLDIFICHLDPKALARETRKVIKYFREKLGEQIFWLVRGNIINLLVPGYNRSLQIILFRNTLPYIIHKFDFSHIQFLYNGEQILTTLAGVEYARTLVSVHSGYYDIHFPKRFYKAKKMKLCLALPRDKHITTNLPTVEKIDYWYPSYTDDLEKVKLRMRSLYSVHKRFVTQGKPFRIHYSKIPTEFHHDRLCHHSQQHQSLTSNNNLPDNLDNDSLNGNEMMNNYG